MNARDDDAWLDAMLQRQLPPGPSDDGFREHLLARLPPPERPWRRALGLGLTWLVAGVCLLWTLGENPGVLSASTDSLLVPSCLGVALLWYLVEHRA